MYCVFFPLTVIRCAIPRTLRQYLIECFTPKTLRLWRLSVSEQGDILHVLFMWMLRSLPSATRCKLICWPIIRSHSVFLRTGKEHENDDLLLQASLRITMHKRAQHMCRTTMASCCIHTEPKPEHAELLLCQHSSSDIFNHNFLWYWYSLHCLPCHVKFVVSPSSSLVSSIEKMVLYVYSTEVPLFYDKHKYTVHRTWKLVCKCFVLSKDIERDGVLAPCKPRNVNVCWYLTQLAQLPISKSRTASEEQGMPSFLAPVSPPVHFGGQKSYLFSGRAISEHHFSERVGRCEQHVCTA